MIGDIRRVKLLAVLALLIAGMLQPLASQGRPCSRAHAPAQVAQQPGRANEASSTIDHGHSSIPQPDASDARSATCGVYAIPVERFSLSTTTPARHLLPPGDPPPARLPIQSHFRPPRLS